jgi:hypothetical protein
VSECDRRLKNKEKEASTVLAFACGGMERTNKISQKGKNILSLSEFG